MNNWKLVATLATIISLGLLSIPAIFPICPPGGRMPCHYSYRAEFLVAGAALLVAGGMWFLKGAEARRTAGLFLVLLGAMTVLIPRPGLLGVCHHGSGGCGTTALWTTGAGILLGIVGMVATGLAHRSGSRRWYEDVEETYAADHLA